MEKVEAVLKYKFKNKKLLEEALTHSSYFIQTPHQKSTGAKIDDNERLEFLGDAVLSMVISDMLFKHRPELSEGEMSLIRMGIVCEESLAEISLAMDLGSFLKLGKGEDRSGGRNRSSILADTCEALIGAIYLDGGINKVTDFINKKFEHAIKTCIEKPGRNDYKTKLQEIMQAKKDFTLEYRIISESGPDHNKLFETELLINGEQAGKGIGRTKKESEQNAAKFVLENYFNKD